MRKLKDYVKTPSLIFVGLMKYTARLWPDLLYVKCYFRLLVGYWPNLNFPQSFNEKLNWLKFNNRKPLYTRMADKYEAKNIVREIIGEEYVVPCYGVWEKSSEINFDALPYPIVLKTTGDTSSVVVCKNKDDIDIDAISKKMDKSVGQNFWFQSREWIYKDIKSKIIADKFLDDGTDHELTDYKFWCFNGEPKYIYITNKARNIFENFYDMDFHPVDINHGFVRNTSEFKKPEAFELMKMLCKRLLNAIGQIPFIRIDFFYVNGHVYFGEFTFYDWAGFRPFANKEQDLELGKFIRL